ncbi:hypothetical protein MC7420_4892 [Coleofasciculus chthonoplastes PCC 7420]|uniref:Uncharacterized protein n=1 Tax=Coleofasciculus chthonoplastes PCC 7420 TaxID=118168 RepID=B4VNK3_9CYAN|nr:hypothetical protein [Coleofasciculus chthonoplastes]EDX76636.1 hypothetical protein MC7420_4892 [Coleofasciculus chthonoplastes PCC 7420]
MPPEEMEDSNNGTDNGTNPAISSSDDENTTNSPITPSTLPSQDYTPSDERIDTDKRRIDLEKNLTKIQPNSGVTFYFNHVVKKSDSDSSEKDLEGTLEKPGNFSIRYKDNPNQTEAPEEQFSKWSLSKSDQITTFYQYLWLDDQTLLVGPPKSGWPNGKYIHFEFDESLQDYLGNNFLNDEDQIVIAYVRSVTEIKIDLADKTYLPWESDDNISGDPNDFYVHVSGSVTEKAGLGHIKKIILNLKSYDDTFTYEISAGKNGHDHLIDSDDKINVGGTKWTPNTNDGGGKWAINLPLKDPKYLGQEAQAVAEKRYKWQMTAVALSSDGVETHAPSPKIVYHEIYQPKVTQVICYRLKKGVAKPNKSDIYYFDEKKSKLIQSELKFNKSDLGSLNSLIIFLKGDFADTTTFRYENSCLNNFSQNFAADIKQSDYDEQGNIVPQGQERAEVQLPAFTIHKSETPHTCIITFRAKTKAGSLVIFHLQYTVHTTALELQDVRAVSLDIE